MRVFRTCRGRFAFADRLVASIEREVKSMVVERARASAVSKPWGIPDLRPWSGVHDDPIGEIWFERSDAAAESSLLLKLLFTSQPLSIQVHPDDAFAQSIGLPRGKTEAWYVLRADPGAEVALGLKERLTPAELRAAVDDGAIADLVVWQGVSPGDTFLVPAGTIHAIGAGLVIAEIQQRSDATFRLFDHGHRRELHVERAVAVADAGPAPVQARSNRLTSERTFLVSSPHFVFERIELAAKSTWQLEAERETWLLLLDGDGRAGSFDVAVGDAIFAQSARVDIHAGPAGLVGLVAYAGGDTVPHLLRRVVTPEAMVRGPPQAVPAAMVLTRATKAIRTHERLGL
jgi:mannose-6-phosphate isomerase